MQWNYLDWGIFLVVLLFAFRGWKLGLIEVAENFVSYFVSLWLSIRYHAAVGSFLHEKFGIALVWTTVLGYLIVAFGSQIIFVELYRRLVEFLPLSLRKSKINLHLGVIVSVIDGLVILSFLLLVLLALPLRGTIKKDIQESMIASRLVRIAEQYGGSVRSSLGEVTQQALQFLTVNPTSKERIALDVTPKSEDLSVDAASENAMLALVNKERTSRGIAPLALDDRLTRVARAHSRDMFVRRYFSHVSPDGKDVGDRLKDADISYLLAGENLAYTPDVTTAHTGLMNSDGHRRNILDPEFSHIGIGVVDAGVYGQMYTQVFMN